MARSPPRIVEPHSQSRKADDKEWVELAAMLRRGSLNRALAPTPTAAVPTRARSTAPVVATTVRGDRALALAAAASDESRRKAMDMLKVLMVAPSAAASQDSLLRTWHAFHCEWFGVGVPVLPLTSEKVYAICAMFRAGGYRAVENYVARAKDSHLEHGHQWTEFLDRACRKAKRAVSRGIGPARQSAALDLEEAYRALHTLAVQPGGRRGPLGPKHLVVCGAVWMMRELELSCAQVKHVSVDRGLMSVEWHLPASKTDVKALGKARSWGCVCAGMLQYPCPVHAVLG